MPQEHELIRRPESGDNWRRVTGSYNVGSLSICNIKNGRTNYSC
jgi:hypothetical protein